ncbi:MAG TPA: hypothetical protein VGI75_06865 [Pirellulales bacterium]|jgi:hypothetical protein
MSSLKLFSDGSPTTLLASAIRYPRGELGEVVTLMLTLTSIAVAGWCAAMLWKRFGGERTINNPRKLFNSLCRAHRLDRNQRRLLLALAHSHSLSQPAMLFLRPDLFNDAYLKPPLAVQAPVVRQLRQRLFQKVTLPANSSMPS